MYCYLLFINYEKAYDNVNRDKLWEMMDNKIPNYLQRLKLANFSLSTYKNI